MHISHIYLTDRLATLALTSSIPATTTSSNFSYGSATLVLTLNIRATSRYQNVTLGTAAQVYDLLSNNYVEDDDSMFRSVALGLSALHLVI